MKRSEVTVEKLKALGYTARKQFMNSWRFGSQADSPCTEAQSEELFEMVVKAARFGESVEIRKNNANYTVNVFVEASWQEVRGTQLTWYLSRPMTEAEVLEANLYTGNWEN